MAAEPAQLDARRGRRALAGGLALAAAVFCGVVAGVMTGAHFAEPAAVPDPAALQGLRDELGKDPTNEAVKQLLREQDLRLRRDYLARRKLLQVGTWLLLAGAASLAVSLRWYASLDPAEPRPSRPGARQDADAWLATRRGRLTAVGGAVALAALAVLVLALSNQGAQPAAPPTPAPVTPGTPLAPAVAAVHPTDEAGFHETWPRFRGPNGVGVVRVGEWPVEWDAASGKNIAWQVEAPLPGKSSPIVWGNRIFLTGATAQAQEVFCFERSSGKLLWRTKVAPTGPRPPTDQVSVMEDTGYAASTPATDGKRVYVTFASADMAAVDFEGKVVWARNLGAPANTYGRATSLLTYKDAVILQFDRGSSEEENLSQLLVLDGPTGKPAWTAPRPVRDSWSTPIIVKNGDRTELITCASPWVISYDPDLGTEIWRAKCLSGDVAPSPAAAGGLVFTTNEGSQVTAIRLGGAGDVTETNIAWIGYDGMSDASSPVANDRFFLQATRAGFINGYDVKTGKVAWETHLEAGVWASPTLAGDMVYLPTESGKTMIFPLAAKFELKHSPTIGEPIYASPVFADGRIYMRGKKRLFCIGPPTGGGAGP